MGKSISGTADGGEAAVDEFFQGIKAVLSFHIGIRRKDCKYRARPPQDVDILAVLGFENPFSRPGSLRLRLLILISDVCLPSMSVRSPDSGRKLGRPATTKRAETIDSKVQDGEDVDVLRNSNPNDYRKDAPNFTMRLFL